MAYNEAQTIAMREAAKKKKKEKYETAGTGIGAVLGTIGAVLSGNPALIGTGVSLGKTVGLLASGEGSLEDAVSGAEQAVSAGMSLGETPDFASMSDDELVSTLKSNKDLVNTEEFKDYALKRKRPLPAFSTKELASMGSTWLGGK